MKRKRVAITGLGVVSAIGIGKESFWNNLIAGRSGISKIESFDTTGFPGHFGGEIKNFNSRDFLSEHECDRMGRASQLAVAAALMAVEDANLVGHSFSDTGVCIGTTMGEIPIIEKAILAETMNDKSAIDYASLLRFPCNNISNNVARIFRFKGPVMMMPNACSAGNFAIGYAFDLLQKGKIERLLVGGSDAFSQIAYIGFSSLGAIAPKKVQPFDINRSGMMVGEGSAIMVIETLEAARKRDARIYSEILGYGISCDAYHITSPLPSGDGVYTAMKTALSSSGLSPYMVDYISAHGTGTKANDLGESHGIVNLFQEHTKKLKVSSIKSMLGHSMGAASAIEAVSCALVIENNILPPTMNHETYDPDVKFNVVPNQAVSQATNIVMNNASAFGGNNSSVIMGKAGIVYE